MLAALTPWNSNLPSISTSRLIFLKHIFALLFTRQKTTPCYQYCTLHKYVKNKNNLNALLTLSSSYLSVKVILITSDLVWFVFLVLPLVVFASGFKSIFNDFRYASIFFFLFLLIFKSSFVHLRTVLYW